MSSSPIITVVVCTYNRHHLLRTVLEGVFAQSLSPDSFEVLVVDHSTDQKNAEAFYTKGCLNRGVRVVWSDPPGLNRARNCGIENCATPYVAFLGDDAIPEPTWLASIVEGFNRDDRTVAVGGPIQPIWGKARPDWLPEAHLAMFAMLEPADSDCDLGPGLHLYGANMAFAVEPVRRVGGFPEQLDRKGSRALLSRGETQIQDELRAGGGLVRYIKAAAVRHFVHEDRIRRNWMRSRMAWQSVSEQMAEPPLYRTSATEELRRIAVTNPGVAAAVQLLFAPVAHETLSEQLSAIHHLLALLLSAHTMDDSEIEAFAENLGASAGPATSARALPRGSADYLPVTDDYAPSAAGAARAQYLFVEGIPGHRNLYDLYGDLPGAHLITYPARNALCDDDASTAGLAGDLAFIYRSIGPTTKSVFFLTLDPVRSGPQREVFLRFISACPARVDGILHALPPNRDAVEMVQRFGRILGKVCFLSETMAEQARSVLGLRNACYLPHHPFTYAYQCAPARRETLRVKLGVSPGQLVFSIIGEARNGKGIDLLINALDHVPIAARRRMFFLITGKARHYNAQDLRTRLIAARTAGAIDLRENAEDLQRDVLTDREYADYVAVADVGLLLYQEFQRCCMSGVLGDYVWAGLPVIATDGSYTGAEVQRNDLGLLLRSEDPQMLAALLVEALRYVEDRKGQSSSAQAYRNRIAPPAVLHTLKEILDLKSESAGSLIQAISEVA